MKMFNKILMASEFDVNRLKDGYFTKTVEGVKSDAAVEDGAFVSIKGLRAHDLYAGMKDLNAREITAYDANEPIFGFVDYVGVSHADVMGVKYRIGDKIAGVYPTAGEGTRVRIPELADEFYLCDENFDSANQPDLTSKKYAVPEAGKTTLKAVSSKPASGFYVEVEDIRDLIMGQVNEGSKMYRCRVMSL